MIKTILLFGLAVLLVLRIKGKIKRAKNMKKKPKVMKGAESKFIKGGKEGVLLLHGFTSTPDEFPWILKNFPKKKYTVSAPLLAGHGTSIEHLDTTTWQDWYRSAEKAYKELRKSCEKIIIVGSSSGGNLGLLLASKYKVDSIVLMGTIVKFKFHEAIRVLASITGIFTDKIKKRHFPRVIEKEINKKRHYRFIPIKSFKVLFGLMKESRNALSNVKSNLLLIQSNDDFLTNKNNVRCIYKQINSKNKEAIIMDSAFHIPVFEKERKEIRSLITRYLDQVK